MAQTKRRSSARPKSNAATGSHTGSAAPAHQRAELWGLILLALGVFLAVVSWFGWDGGFVGPKLDYVLEILIGRAATVFPVALMILGLLILVRNELIDLRPFRAGLVVFGLALTVALGAGSFGLGPPGPAPKTVDPAVVTDYGGLLGGALAFVLRTLVGDVGTAIVSALGLVSGSLLITGASLGAQMRRSARASARAARQTAGAARRGVGSLAVPALPRPKPAPSHQHEPSTLMPPSRSEPVDAALTYADITTGELHRPQVFDASAELRTGYEQLVPPPVTQAPIESPGASQAVVSDPQPVDVPEPADDLGFEALDTAEYRLPERSVLRRSTSEPSQQEMAGSRVGEVLVETLAHFGVEATVVGQVSGPRVTRYELRLAPGTKVSKVAGLKDDLAYALATTEIRILAPIPGKQAVGVEVPNLTAHVVTLGDIAEGVPANASPLTVWLGKDISGTSITADLARMPHLLIAGTTGSGKSGCINTMLCSILLRATPDDVRMILVDPKRVELGPYESIPHLLTPVVSNPKRAAAALLNVVEEMERRYELLSAAKARNLAELNRALARRGEEATPYLLVVIDELADLMMISPQDVEDAVIRLAQKSRAVGIHLVLATQRPSVDVITGLIKANVPSRIAFAVSSQTDSRVILDGPGAESLLGQGDMLFKPLGTSRVQRIQGAYVTEEEIALIVEQCRAQRRQELDESLLRAPERDEPEPDEDGNGLDPDNDPLLEKAIDIVVQTQTASVSLIQRRLRVGYTRAGRLVDMLERRGIISGYEGSKPRRVLVTEAELERSRSAVGAPS